jgi:hypothetical protein
MQLADLVIDPSQQAGQQLVRTYESARNLDGTYSSAESQFEHDCLALLEEGWQLKGVNHRGSIVMPCMAVVATYIR